MTNVKKKQKKHFRSQLFLNVIVDSKGMAIYTGELKVGEFSLYILKFTVKYRKKLPSLETMVIKKKVGCIKKYLDYGGEYKNCLINLLCTLAF